MVSSDSDVYIYIERSIYRNKREIIQKKYQIAKKTNVGCHPS